MDDFLPIPTIPIFTRMVPPFPASFVLFKKIARGVTFTCVQTSYDHKKPCLECVDSCFVQNLFIDFFAHACNTAMYTYTYSHSRIIYCKELLRQIIGVWNSPKNMAKTTYTKHMASSRQFQIWGPRIWIHFLGLQPRVVLIQKVGYPEIKPVVIIYRDFFSVKICQNSYSPFLVVTQFLETLQPDMGSTMTNNYSIEIRPNLFI